MGRAQADSRPSCVCKPTLIYATPLEFGSRATEPDHLAEGLTGGQQGSSDRSKLAAAYKEEELEPFSGKFAEEGDNKLAADKMSMREVVGDFKMDAIIEQLGELRENLKKLGFNQPRPWREFFACFQPPKKWRKTEVEERVSANFFHYRSNYAIILATVLGLTIFSSYLTIAVLCVSVGSYALLLGWGGQLEAFGRVLDRRDRTIIASVFSLFVFLISGTLLRVIWTMSAALLLVTGHILFRPRTLSSKANLMKEELKLNGFMGNKTKGDEDVESPMHEEGYGSYQVEGSRTARSRS